jgi:hypothetical protein
MCKVILKSLFFKVLKRRFKILSRKKKFSMTINYILKEMRSERQELIEIKLFIWSFQLIQEKKVLGLDQKVVWTKAIQNNKINSRITVKKFYRKRFLAKKIKCKQALPFSLLLKQIVFYKVIKA